MNNKGEIIIPPIFPKEIEVGVDEEASRASWEEYLNYAANSASDAYEGDSDALWNTD